MNGKPTQSRDKILGYYLHDMCVRLGYCLAPAVQEELIANPPETPAEFVKEIILAEGLDPVISRHYDEMLTELVRRVGETFDPM